MKEFGYSMPVRLRFGAGTLRQLPEAAGPHGRSALLVTGRWTGAKAKLHETCRRLLEDAGLKVGVFDGVLPNPTTATVREAAAVGRRGKCEVVVGVGGGSVMDVAKAAAVEMTHPLGCFEYAYFQPQQPTAATLPIILVTTTSGTGSHVSKCSVVTHETTSVKTGIVSEHIFARDAIVDPTLMLSVPPPITAATGFDVFTHAFESLVNRQASPMGDLYACEAIRILAESLPVAFEHGHDLEARSRMAWADTLAGMCIANVGTTLPHSMGQPISGHFPRVSHGQALAIVYPPIMSLSWSGAVAKFAAVARLLDPSLRDRSDEEAARASRLALETLLERIGLLAFLMDVGVGEAAVETLVTEAMSFPDTRANPIVPTSDEVRRMFLEVLGKGR